MDAFAWLDLETTGLDPKDGLILEVAVVLTDMKLNYLHSRETLGCLMDLSVEEVQKNCDPFVQEMHTNNGLWIDLESRPFEVGSELDYSWYRTLRDWQEIFSIEKLYLAGSSVHFDYRWLLEHMPMTAALFTHRFLDVSAIKLMELVKTGSYESDKGTAHRALADAMASLTWLKKYLNPVVEITDVEVEATRLLHQFKTNE